jgi:hypothetical protein
MTLCTHWSEGFFGGLHCDETLNVIVLTCIMTWVSHMKWNLFPSLYNNLKITMWHKWKLWHVKLFNSNNSHVTWDFFIWILFFNQISILNEIEYYPINFGQKIQEFKTHIIHKDKTQVKPIHWMTNIFSSPY